MDQSTISSVRRFGFRKAIIPVLAIVFSFFAAADSSAQSTATIRGTVLRAADGTPVAGAAVELGGTERVTLTDVRGRFSIDVPAGTHEIIARRLGLEPASESVTIAAGATSDVTLRLMEAAVLIPTVVVSATQEQQRLSETAASVGVITSEALREAKPTHPSSVMSQVPGVWVNVTGGEGHMTSIRQPIGTKPLYLFLEDGVPTRSTGFFNHNALYEVNLPQAERVEVLKGPASALYGSDAIGGVINVETRRPSSDPTFEAFLEGGEYGYNRLMLTGSNSWGTNGFLFDLNLTGTDGWRSATGYDRQSGTLRWDSYIGSNTTLSTVVTGSLIDQQTAGTSALPDSLFRTDPTLNLTPVSLRNVRAFRYSTSAEIRGDRTLVSITPFARWNEMELLPNWSLTYDPTIYTTGHSSVGVIARMRREIEPLNARFIAGLDVDYSPGWREEHRISTTRSGNVFTAYELGDVIYDYDVTFRGISPYIQADANVTDALHLTAGLRYDDIRYDYETKLTPTQEGNWRIPENASPSYSSLSPKLGASYDFGRQLNVFANYTRGFRAPSEGQIFRQGRAQNTIDLKPVAANSVEAGARGALADRVGYSVAVYQMRVTNDILTYTLPDGNQETQNAGETLHRGVELGLNVLLTEDVRADINYTRAKHTYEEWSPRAELDFGGKQMEAAPDQILNGQLSYRPGFLPNSRFALEWNHLGSYWLNPENDQQYEGHNVFNLHVNVGLPYRLELLGRMTNLTDTRYAELASYTQQRGRELAPGMPRTLYLGLQYSWGR